MSNTIHKSLTLENDMYYIKHLQIINPVLPTSMTPKEIEVLGTFMGLKGEIAEEDRFGTFCRKKVKVKLNLSNGGLANYLRTLKDKGFIQVGEDGQYTIPIVLTPSDIIQDYKFKIINTQQDGKSTVKKDASNGIDR